MKRAKSKEKLNGALLAAGILLIAAVLHTTDAHIRAEAASQANVQVSTQQFNYGDEYLIYDMNIPDVSGFADFEFERTLNLSIAAQVAQDKAEAESYAKDFMQRVSAGTMLPYDCVFSVSYEAKCTAGILSFKVTTLLDNGGTGMPHTVYYNADIAACEMLTLDGLFLSGGYKGRINRVIESWIEKDPDSYGEPFKGVSEDTKFFISDGRLYIAFAKYEIAAGTLGEPELGIPTETFYDILKPEYRALFYG